MVFYRGQVKEGFYKRTDRSDSKPSCAPRERDVVAQITDLCVRADRQPGLALIQSLQERCGGLIDDPGLTLPP